MGRRYVTVNVDVDVDIADLDESDIEDIAEAKGLSLGSATKEQITEMFWAFRMGRDEKAIEIAKLIAQDTTGMIL